MRKYRKFYSKAVQEVFNSYPKTIKDKLLFLRQLIFEVAEETQGVGELEETLKWGEPSYVTAETRSGSTVRIGWKKSHPLQYAMYFNCRTTLVDTFKEIYGDLFRYEGNRSIIFNVEDEIPINELSDCIAMTLKYRLIKKRRKQMN